MVDKQVAVVTGYYGVSDQEDETFVKKAFGVLRKQFHSRPQISCEEATFSEGKCDLYRKEYLTKAGGFPTEYRIAGEDLIVSYTLRNNGYKIIKCYDLPVIQRFTGDAETFSGNLRKEFLFGKVMGGVFLKFRLFLFKGMKNAKYSGSRSLHRATQPLFVLGLMLSFLLIVFFWWSALLVILLLILRHLYYVSRIRREFIDHTRYKRSIIESILTGLIGILTDFAYTFGFGYGLIKYSLGATL
jgi:hypothetical protein